MKSKYKFSPVHQFKVYGKNFLYDINRSFFLEIDNITDEILVSLKKLNNEMIDSFKATYSRKEIIESIDELKKVKILFEIDTLAKNSKEKLITNSSTTQIPVTAMDFNIAHDCNFRCKYCYGGEGNYQGPRELMNENVATNAVDFFLKHSLQHKKCEIIFFGGEPLLNFKVIKHVVDYSQKIFEAKGKDIAFGMTTNGLLLTDDIIRYLNENKFSVTISLDGNQSTHDKMRVLKNGKGSYSTIAPKIVEFIKSRKGRVPVRATVTHYNMAVGDIIEDLFNFGFDNILWSPVTASKNAPYSLDEDDFFKLKNELEKLAQRFVQNVRRKQNWSFHPFPVLLRKIHNSNRKNFGCGGGRNYIMVDPAGDLYICHRCGGNEALKLGDLRNGINYEKQKMILEARVDNRIQCKDCWAKYLCGGGCFYENYFFNQDLSKSEERKCDLFRFQIELATWVYSELHEEEKDFITRHCEIYERSYMKSNMTP